MLSKIISISKWLLFGVSLLISSGASTKIYIQDYKGMFIGYLVSAVIAYVAICIGKRYKKIK